MLLSLLNNHKPWNQFHSSAASRWQIKECACECMLSDSGKIICCSDILLVLLLKNQRKKINMFSEKHTQERPDMGISIRNSHLSLIQKWCFHSPAQNLLVYFHLDVTWCYFMISQNDSSSLHPSFRQYRLALRKFPVFKKNFSSLTDFPQELVSVTSRDLNLYQRDVLIAPTSPFVWSSTWG